eukprot:TRINITY_DN8747_c0_g2_i1.p2 TRINITY_DN8747_c0_g2~~TRINITY_DN8747_c0_g2_i1.p2  ORF type:complete len:641 (+),score=162.36 TRINITY_DN8747_c0_g2_i1:82-1923(+)
MRAAVAVGFVAGIGCTMLFQSLGQQQPPPALSPPEPLPDPDPPPPPARRTRAPQRRTLAPSPKGPPRSFNLVGDGAGAYERAALTEGAAAWSDRGYSFEQLAPELRRGALYFRGPHKGVREGSRFWLHAHEAGRAYLLVDGSPHQRHGGWQALPGWEGLEEPPLQWQGVEGVPTVLTRALRPGDMVSLPATTTAETVFSLIVVPGSGRAPPPRRTSAPMAPSREHGAAGPSAPPPGGGGGTSADDRVVCVYTTGCDFYQQWQSEALAHSHMLVGQRGRLVRVISGCAGDPEAPQGKNLFSRAEAARTSHPRMEHYFARSVKGAAQFAWLNKPHGFLQWIKQAGLPADSVVVILDPDQAFVSPLRLGRAQHEVIRTRPRRNTVPELPALPRPGKPVGQQYGLGDTWITKFDRRKICGEGSPCLQPTTGDAWDYYAVGPPLLLLAEDAARLGRHWARLMGPVLQASRGDIITDMWAYSMAAAHLRMPHLTLDHFMVSDPDMSEARLGEGWHWVDRWPRNVSCRNPQVPPGHLAPTLVHYCQRYRATDSAGRQWMWYKGDMRSDLLRCNATLPRAPPDDLFATQTTKFGRRSAFMLCYLHHRLRGSVAAWRRKHCA